MLLDSLFLFFFNSVVCAIVYKASCIQDGKKRLECCGEQSSRAGWHISYCKFLLIESFSPNKHLISNGLKTCFLIQLFADGFLQINV